MKSLFKLLTLSFIGYSTAIIRGINWYGCETPRYDFTGTWSKSIEEFVDQFHSLGINYLRIPFSHEYVQRGDFSSIDRLFNAVKKYPDMKILLDYHRTWASHQSYKPDAEISLDEFKRTWITIIQRYVNEPSLEAVDIFNEYQGNDVGFWNWITHDIVNHIEWNFPNRLKYFIGGTQWGSSLAGISLEDLPFNDRIFYSIHRYHWHNDDWGQAFGNLPSHKINVGEYGWKTTQWNEKQWAFNFINYLKARGIKNTFFWCHCLSGDTDGLFYDNCVDVDWDKYNILKNYWKDSEDQPSQEL